MGLNQSSRYEWGLQDFLTVVDNRKIGCVSQVRAKTPTQEVEN